MIFTPNRKPMRPNELGTFVVRRPGILGLNDSLKKGAKCIRLPSLPPSSSFPLISKKPQQVLEKSWRDALLAVYKGGTSSVTLMPISPHKHRDWLPPEPRNKRIWFIYFLVDLLIDNKALYCATWCGERARRSGRKTFNMIASERGWRTRYTYYNQILSPYDDDRR